MLVVSLLSIDTVAVSLDVNSFSEPVFDEGMIENLAMKPERVETLKALSKSYIRRNNAGNETTQKAWSADFVPGKGEGLIFLLHGKPGVGKTCTAGQCLSEHRIWVFVMLHTRLERGH